MAGSLSALGIGSNAGLNSETIDGLKQADTSIMVTPIDRKIETNKSQQGDLSTFTTYLAGVKTQTSTLSDELTYLKRSSSVSGSSVTASVDSAVNVQDIDINVTQLAKQSTFESASFSSLEDNIFASTNTDDRTFSFYVGDTKKTVNLGKEAVTYEDLITAINDQYGSDVTASTLKISDSEYKMILKADTTGDGNQISFGTSNLTSIRELNGSVDLTGLTYNYTVGGDLTLNGTTILSNGATVTDANDFVTQINTALTGAGLDSSFSASLDASNQLVLQSLDGTAISLSDAGTTLTDMGLSSELIAKNSTSFSITDSQLKINGVDIVSGANKSYTSLQDLVDDINSKTNETSSGAGDGTGVYATLDASNNIELKNVNGSTISLTGDDWSKLGFTTTSLSAISDGGVSGTTEDVSATLASTVGFNSLQNAQDAKFTYNGVEISRDQNKITDLVTGLTLNLEETGSSTIKIKRDSDSIVDAVDQFVSTYNTMINKWNDLTDYNKEKDTAGSFQGVSEVVRVKSTLNRLILGYDSTADIKSLEEIGISLNESGLLTFDSSKLETQISSDFDAVEKLFRGYTGSINGQETEIEGSFAKLNSSLDAMIGDSGSLTLFDSNLTRQKDNLEKEREKAVERIDTRYEIMSAQFAAYDSMIASMNSGFQSLQMQIDAMVASK